MNLKLFNDYSCVLERDPEIKEVYHFTKSEEALLNIVTGCFWATDIRDFRRNDEDESEGYLVLYQIMNHIRDMDASMANIVEKYIGTEEAKNNFFDAHETYLVSTCIGTDLQYMWERYAGDIGYQIVFDKEELINSLYIVLKNGRTRSEKSIFKHARLLYDSEKQIEIIKKEYQKLIENQDRDMKEQYYVEYILRHLMYIGSFYKRNEKCYIQEDEYRILVNIASHDNANIEEFLPERRFNPHNKKHYIEIRFSPKAITRIVCATEQSKKQINDRIPNIEIEVRKRPANAIKTQQCH